MVSSIPQELVVSDAKYKAWGNVRYASGANSTAYTYTGQYSHTADFGLMFYNARWYDPSLGRFASADSIVPAGVQGYDRYAYGLNNPVKYTDPSGHCAVDGDDWCSNNGNKIKSSHNSSSWYLVELEQNYNWTFEGSWTNAELKIIYQVAIDVSSAVGGVAAMLEMFGAIAFDKKAMGYGGLGEAHHITLNEDSSQWDTWSVAHELGHAWDGANEWHLSEGLQNSVGSEYPILYSGRSGSSINYGTSGNGPGATGWPTSNGKWPWDKAKNWNGKEDFAQSFAAYIYPTEAANKLLNNYRETYQMYGYSSYGYTPRGQYIRSLIPGYWSR